MNVWLQSIDGMLSAPEIAITLLSLVIKSTLILAATLLTSMLCRERPVLRSFVLTHGLSLSLILPLLMFVAPDWHLPLLSWLHLPGGTETSTVAVSELHSAASTTADIWTPSIISILIVVWLLGAFTLLARHALGWFLMRGIVRRAACVDNHDVRRIVERIKTAVKVRRKVHVAYSSEINSPVTAGLWRHTIILPSYARQWSRQLLEMSLVHELAHVRRRDVCWYTLGAVAAAINWFNPLVWMCRRRMVTESEKACDDFVIMNGNDVHTYAETLLGIARQVSRVRLVAPVGVRMTRKSELEGRLMSIMSDHKRSAGVRGAVLAAAVLLTFALVLPLAGVQLSAAVTEPQTSLSAPMGDDKASEAKADYEAKKKELAQKEQQKKDLEAKKEYEEQRLKEKQKQAAAKGSKADQYPNPDEFVKMTHPPEMIKKVTPEYSKKAIKAKMEGDVWVKVLVDTEGLVKKAMVQKTSGYEQLDKAALKAAYECKYKPADYEGKKVAAWVTYKVTFANDGEEL